MEEQFKKEHRQTDRDIHHGIKESGETLSNYAKDTIVQEFDRICSALHTASHKLHEDNSYLAGIFDTVSDSADSASRFVREHEPAELLDKVRDFSRRNPYALTGGLFIAGFALSRFLKTGSTDTPDYKEEKYEHGA
jgi:hypothetical protein